MDKMSLPHEAGPISGRGGGDVPVCIKVYAIGENVIGKELIRSLPSADSILFGPYHHDKEGKVKHIHFLSAFPDQAKAITDASRMEIQAYLSRRKPWRWKPHLVWTCPTIGRHFHQRMRRNE